jgi:hypothetical protein
MRDAIPREAASVRVAVYGWDSTARRYRVRSGSAYSDSGASLGVSSNEATGLACVASRQSRRWLDGIRWFSCMSYSMAFVHIFHDIACSCLDFALWVWRPHICPFTPSTNHPLNPPTPPYVLRPKLSQHVPNPNAPPARPYSLCWRACQLPWRQGMLWGERECRTGGDASTYYRITPSTLPPEQPTSP